MTVQERLIHSFDTTRWLIDKFADGMSHEESLAVPSFRANSFNWVLGHILVSRDRVLDLLGQPAVLSAEGKELYDTGSEPVDAEKAISLSRLLSGVDASQTAIGIGLQEISDGDLLAIYDKERDQSVLERIEGLHWHETYHVGQLEILRQVSAERPAFP